VSRLSLLTKLLLALLLPMVLTFVCFGLLGHYVAQRALEAELGRRLSGIAAVVATQIAPDSVALLAPGDEDSRTYRNLRRRLTEVRDAAGVARVYVFAADLTTRVDTDSAPIGARDYSLDISRAELRSVFPQGSGRPAASVLFRGRDGRLYKSGYAPIVVAGQDAPYAVGVDGSAALYAELQWLRRTLFGVGLTGVAGLVLAAVLWGRRVTLPLARLTASARTMGSGVLDVPMEPRLLVGRDEVAFLAQGLEAMRQDLRARDERMQMMLAGIAHEVRNPLGGMELFAGLLREELDAAPSDPAVARGYVDKILKELHHLQAVVADFLEYARRQRPVVAPTALGELLQEVADSAQGSAPAGVAVRVEVDGGAGEPPVLPILPILVDANQLRRALQNLAHNAVQACADVGDGRERQVTLSCGAVGDQVVVRIRDTGPGIPEDVVGKIWTPFFTTRAQGTGLGLAFVREIIVDHGGRIEVTTAPTGTTFTVTLPARRAASPPSARLPPMAATAATAEQEAAAPPG
jgi:signal transduction histidine kinase